MRKTNNYELNLVEGSDIVNPLVQDVPNYEIIDTEMHKNANNSIPLATELLSGTVHALTRENPNASMFRFVATSNFKSGETFTVDGVQVTALLTTGESLATGCYVINSNVLCCLVGTVLTLFCANSLVEIHAVDSDKLGGEDAGYYAPNSSVVEAINLAQNANQISLSNKEEIDAVVDNLGGFTPVIDETGKVTGYKTNVGGADTVFPFSSGKDIVYIGVQATTFTSGWTEAQWFNGKTNTVGTIKVYMEQAPKSATIVDKLQIEYNKIVALTDGIKYMKNKAGSTWTTLPKGASVSASIGGTGSTSYLTFMCE